MIEVLALAGAVSKIAGSVTAAVKAGRDIQSIMPQVGKLAKLEADINLAETGKHKNPLSRLTKNLTSSEEEGFAIAQAKMAHKQAQDELRSACLLYGPPGMWDMVVHEQAAARTRQKQALEDAAKRRDKLFYILSCILGGILMIGGSVGMIYLASWLGDGNL